MQEFAEFMESDSNGMAVTCRMIKINTYMAVLNYRASHLPWCNWNPAELLGRRLKTDIPATAKEGIHARMATFGRVLRQCVERSRFISLI